MNAEDALYAAKMLKDKCFSNPSFIENIVVDKLCEALYIRLNGKKLKKASFNQYLDTVNALGYACTEGDGINIEWKNQACDGTGWRWFRVTGPDEVEELNRSEIFTYECSDFVMSYQIYTAFKTNDVDIRAYLNEDGDTTYNALSDMVCPDNLFDWLEFGQMEVCDDEASFHNLVKYYVYGAYYIACRLSGEKMEEQYEREFERLAEETKCAPMVGCMKYYDCFFDGVLRESGYLGEAGEIMLPYLLDAFFSFKDTDPGSGCGTPCLYIYSSESMKEYKDFRNVYPTHPFIEIMDALLVLLEDPAQVLEEHSMEEGKYMFTDCLSMVEKESLSVCSAYTEKEYVACYYSFNRGAPLILHPCFWLARECFDILLSELKTNSDKSAGEDKP